MTTAQRQRLRLRHAALFGIGRRGRRPVLRESWEETPTSVTYTLKEGITCGDGTPLTASTVADNFRFVADPANQSPLLGVFVPPGITVDGRRRGRARSTSSSEQPVPFLLSLDRAQPVHRLPQLAWRTARLLGRARTAPARSSSRRRCPTTTTRYRAPGRLCVGTRRRDVRRAWIPVRGGDLDRRKRVDGGQPAARRATPTPLIDVGARPRSVSRARDCPRRGPSRSSASSSSIRVRAADGRRRRPPGADAGARSRGDDGRADRR